MVTLNVELTDEQYARYKAGFKKLSMLDADTDPTDEQLIAQLKREAAAITCAAENDSGPAANGWSF